MSGATPFFELVQDALMFGALRKATLSRPVKSAPAGLRNVFLRPVEIRGLAMVAWAWRYERRDEVKNLTATESLARLRELCGPVFRNTDVFTADREITLTHNRRGEPTVFVRQAVPAPAAPEPHDRTKARLLDPSAPWLHELGITGPQGAVLAASQAKWRQINKFLEIIAGLLPGAALPDDAHIADMGCGKGYLTFALYDYLTTRTTLRPHITGIEQRPHLVAICNHAAERAAFSGLRFESGNIQDWQPERLDMLIALHACDTATDEALAAGVRAGARVIVAAPCCHKQVRQSMDARNEMAPVLEHGILAERQAEILTDGLRALLLEGCGYRTKVFEFISPEHTAKNLMITAIRQERVNPKAAEQIAAIKSSFGIREHRLETLLDAPAQAKS